MLAAKLRRPLVGPPANEVFIDSPVSSLPSPRHATPLQPGPGTRDSILAPPGLYSPALCPLPPPVCPARLHGVLWC